jgi:hypothetical protein
MGTRTESHRVQVIGQEGPVNQEIERGAYAGRNKAKGVIGRIRNLVGRVVTVEEDWMLKSRDWPYMWKKK